MARPTAKSGIALLQNIVAMPAEMIATFATASFLADKYAANAVGAKQMHDALISFFIAAGKLAKIIHRARGQKIDAAGYTKTLMNDQMTIARLNALKAMF